jgi:cell division protein FtsZ
MYEAASEDALIIRGLSQDGNLGENISVTVIATGFPSNSIFTPYKKPKPKIVEILTVNNPVPHQILPDNDANEFTVRQKSSGSVISNIDDDDVQGEFDFDLERAGEVTGLRERNQHDDVDEKENRETTLQKVKHMQNFFKKEGLSNKIIKDNIETFEDVPAYVRRNMPLVSKEKENDSKVSKFTIQLDDDNEPVIREDNAYLNHNVD